MVFVCEWEGLDDATLALDARVKCFDLDAPLHLLLLFVACLGLVLYYPLASLIAPNLQFSNQSLDVKWDQTFLIIDAQTQLFLVGISVFYGDSGALAIGPIFLVTCVMALLTHRLQPCMVKDVNLVRVATLLVAAWSCVGTFWAMTFPSQSGDVAWAIMSAGWFVIIAATSYVLVRKHRAFLRAWFMKKLPCLKWCCGPRGRGKGGGRGKVYVVADDAEAGAKGEGGKDGEDDGGEDGEDEDSLKQKEESSNEETAEIAEELGK